MNRVGFANCGTTFACGGFDGQGETFESISWSNVQGVPVSFMAPGVPNTVCGHVKINLTAPGYYSRMHLAGAGSSGRQCANITLVYADGNATIGQCFRFFHTLLAHLFMFLCIAIGLCRNTGCRTNSVGCTSHESARAQAGQCLAQDISLTPTITFFLSTRAAICAPSRCQRTRTFAFSL